MIMGMRVGQVVVVIFDSLHAVTLLRAQGQWVSFIQKAG